MNTPKPTTIAPPKYCTVKIKATFKASGKPVPKATGHSEKIGANEAVRELGRTRADGTLTNLKFLPGKYKIFLTHKNHQAEGKPQGNHISQSVIFDGELTEGKLELDVQLIQVASSITVQVTESGTHLPIPQADVSVGTFSGKTNSQGKVVTDGLAAGTKHTITAKRTAYGPPSGSVEGEVTGTVDLSGATTVSDTNLSIEMKSMWGRVKSGDITVDGTAFPEWYKANFHPPAQPKLHPTIKVDGHSVLPFPLMSSAASFTTFFNDLGKWNAQELTVEEFVAIFLIVSNETGGTYLPIAEKGSSEYLFYLNKPPNRLAGTLLKERGKLTTDEQAKVWNKKGSKNFPVSFTGPDPNDPKKKIQRTIEQWNTEAQKTFPLLTHADLEECDFHKFRGRGFIQETNYTNYLGNVDPVLKAAKLSGCETLSNAELDEAMRSKPEVYYPVLKAHLGIIRKQWALTNNQEWRQFGLAIAGLNNTGYGDLFQYRCENLYAKLKVAADAGKLILK